jgi:hypothetical protein
MAGSGRRNSDAVVALGAAASAASVLRKGWTARFISKFATTAIRRGMHSGSRAWLYAGAAASGLRVLHMVAGKREEILRVKLKPGQALEIREIVRTK